MVRKLADVVHATDRIRKTLLNRCAPQLKLIWIRRLERRGWKACNANWLTFTAGVDIVL